MINSSLSSCLVRHQNGHKVMSVNDVVVLSSGILRLCGTKRQLVRDRYDPTPKEYSEFSLRWTPLEPALHLKADLDGTTFAYNC